MNASIGANASGDIQAKKISTIVITEKTIKLHTK
jgi:hypothetical protein